LSMLLKVLATSANPVTRTDSINSPDCFASADTYSLCKAFVQTPALKLTEQCQFHMQDKPSTNVGMSHPTRLFWAFVTRFDGFHFIAPFFKRLGCFSLTL
jgi:hypothetical protein